MPRIYRIPEDSFRVRGIATVSFGVRVRSIERQ